jgi:hypothetical protein
MLKKILLISVLVAAVASVAAASPLFLEKLLGGEPVGASLSAVSTDTAIVIKYVGGASGGGEVAVADATGDITLTIGGAADTTTECPVSGAYGGVIDVSNASCNTLGEVVDAINFSDNWRAAIVNGLRSDSSDNMLYTIAATNADAKDGLALAWDTAVALKMTQTLAPSESADMYWDGTAAKPNLFANPFADHQMCATWYSENVTTGGAATITFYSVKQQQARGKLNAAGTGFTGGSSTVTTLFSAAGGATTVVRELDFLPHAPICSKKGEKLVMRTSATSSLTVPLINATGYYFVP